MIKNHILFFALSALMLSACTQQEQPPPSVPASVVSQPASAVSAPVAVNVEEKVLNIYK